jgi:hypothetical protein
LWTDWLLKQVSQLQPGRSRALIVATTDLTHYGPEYGSPRFPFPQQLTKLQLEAPLIQSLMYGDVELLHRTLQETPFVSDSPHVLHVLATLVSRWRRRGEVVDYYDSSAIDVPLTVSSASTAAGSASSRGKHTHVNNALDLYTMSWHPVVRFVSYVGIVWPLSSNRFRPQNARAAGARTAQRAQRAQGAQSAQAIEMGFHPRAFDVMQALGAVRSVVALDTLMHSKGESSEDLNVDDGEWSQILPSWSLWRNPATSDFGVFVGTEFRNPRSRRPGRTPNCSYGRFPSDNSDNSDRRRAGTTGEGHLTLADKILAAAGNCWEDAAYRWRQPYTLADLACLGCVKFKVELLMPRRTWRWLPARTALKERVARMLSGAAPVQGVQLVIPGVGSATYLPVVAQEWTSKHGQDADDYLSELSLKLGGQSNDWKRENAKGGVYHTLAWFWNDSKQEIEVASSSPTLARAFVLL